MASDDQFLAGCREVISSNYVNMDENEEQNIDKIVTKCNFRIHSFILGVFLTIITFLIIFSIKYPDGTLKFFHSLFHWTKY